MDKKEQKQTKWAKTVKDKQINAFFSKWGKNKQKWAIVNKWAKTVKNSQKR